MYYIYLFKICRILIALLDHHVDQVVAVQYRLLQIWQQSLLGLKLTAPSSVQRIIIQL